jgi:hypothetical protein
VVLALLAAHNIFHISRIKVNCIVVLKCRDIFTFYINSIDQISYWNVNCRGLTDHFVISYVNYLRYWKATLWILNIAGEVVQMWCEINIVVNWTQKERN